jgi:hypothetical protein
LISGCNHYPSIAATLAFNRDDLESLVTTIATHIDRGLNCTSNLVVSGVSLTYLDYFNSKELFVMPESQRVKVITESDYYRIRGDGVPIEGVKGAYHSLGKIFLINGKWCFSTFIHENLHSRSSLSTIHDVFEFVYEGITEYLVGKVLKSQFPQCFEEWSALDFCFSTGYIHYVIPWLYLDLNNLFDPIKDIYFDITDDKPLERIGLYLQNALGGNFVSLFNYSNIDNNNFYNFLTSLGEVFGSDFSEDFVNTDLSRSLRLRGLT